MCDACDDAKRAGKHHIWSLRESWAGLAIWEPPAQTGGAASSAPAPLVSWGLVSSVCTRALGVFSVTVSCGPRVARSCFAGERSGQQRLGRCLSPRQGSHTLGPLPRRECLQSNPSDSLAVLTPSGLLPPQPHSPFHVLLLGILPHNLFHESCLRVYLGTPPNSGV